MPQLTNWIHPKKIIESEYGFIPYDQWCSKEIERMTPGGNKYKIRRERDKISIFITKKKGEI